MQDPGEQWHQRFIQTPQSKQAEDADVPLHPHGCAQPSWSGILLQFISPSLNLNLTQGPASGLNLSPSHGAVWCPGAWAAPRVCAPVPLAGQGCPTDHRNFLSSGTQVIWVIVKYTRNLTTHSFIRDITQVPPTFNSNIGSLEIFSSIRKGVLMTVISSFFSPSTLQRLGAQIYYYSAENKINRGTNKHRGSLILSNFWGYFSFTLISLISVVGGRAPLLPTFSLF